MDLKESTPLVMNKSSKPSLLLWVMILPQIVLLLLNINSWTLVSGEMSAVQKKMAIEIFAFELVLLTAGILIFMALQWLKREISMVFCTALLLVHVAYLWLITAWLFKLLPESVTIWIFTPDEALYYQYIFMMPVIFYAGVRLATFSVPISKSKDVSITIATLILVPLISYLFLMVLDHLLFSLNMPTFIYATLFVGATVITMMAFLRILTFIYFLLKSNKAGYWVLLLAVGLAGPIAGLALNRTIPFPCDFQSISVYVLAIINGLVLLISFKAGTKREVFAWFLRCLMYPFSMYFFLVFLPFLPLSVLAMIAAGGGFLILAPVALFIIHTRKLVDEGKHVARMIGVKTALTLFIAGFLVMPAVIAVRATLDRHALMQAVDAVYNPDYSKPNIEIKPESVKHSLLKLRDMKEGIFLPFISSFYNKVVFNGMVLPDYKMNEIYLMFFGEEMPKSKSGATFNFRDRDRFRNTPINMPERNVQISDITVDEKQDGGFIKANIQLTLHNEGRSLSEFVAEIRHSEGLLVSGYWLDIKGQKVKGHIFEQKAAMWVYHMIRDMTRRDPGLLVYKVENVLKLSVFPFDVAEQRTTNIEVLYPVGIRPWVRIGDRTLELGSTSAQGQHALLLAKTGNNTSIIVPPGMNHKLPAFRRQPYIHFIVDSSASARADFNSFGKTMATVAQGFPQANGCRITLANYEVDDLAAAKFIKASDIQATIAEAYKKPIKFKGAFCYERVIKEKLLEFSSMPVDFNTVPPVPIYVVIKAKNSKTALTGDMSPFSKLLPEAAQYYIPTSDSNFAVKGFDTKEQFSSHIDEPEPVVLFKNGNAIAACATNANWSLADFPGSADCLFVYEPNDRNFKPVDNISVLDSNSTYAKGLGLWAKYRATVYSPSLLNDQLPEIVAISKDCGVLTPLTSYIVLENSAQLEMLKRKERQGLKANNALEFDEFMESPAPPIIFLAPIAIALLIITRRHAT